MNRLLMKSYVSLIHVVLQGTAAVHSGWKTNGMIWL